VAALLTDKKVMNNNTAAVTYETPMALLRRVLPTVGFTLSTDADYIFRALYKRGMKNGDMKAAILAWAAKAAAQRDADMARYAAEDKAAN